jgi:glycosyltransferase involved in cell wall biosynthesis
MNNDTIVLIPSFNEERSIGDIVRRVLKNTRIKQCIVIDDHSTDKTAQTAIRAGATVLFNTDHQGTGQSIVTGLCFIKKKNIQTIVLMDADGQHDPGCISSLIHEIDAGADLVIGSRYCSKTTLSTSYVRQIGTKIISFLLLLFYKKQIYDPTSGFRAMNKRTLQYLCTNYPTIFSEPEIVICLIKKNFRIKEITVVMRHRKYGKSSISPFKAAWLMVYICWKIPFDVFVKNKERNIL